MILVAIAPPLKNLVQMGCCELDSGESVSAIPFRNLNNLRSSALPLCQQEDRR